MPIRSRTYSIFDSASSKAAPRLCSSIAILALLISNACSTVPPASASADESRRKTEIRLWHGWRAERQEILESIVDEYDRLDPGSRISVESPASSGGFIADRMLLGGARPPPDLALVDRDSIPLLVEAGLIRPLDDLITPQAESGRFFRKRNLLDPALAYGTYDGNLYGLPAYLNPYVLVYDPKVLRADMGTALPPASWGDLVDMAETLRASNEELWALSVRSIAPVFHILSAQSGINLLEAEPGTAASAAIKKNLDFIRSMRQSLSLLPPQYKFWNPKFAGVADGRALFQIDSATMFAHMKQASPGPLEAAAVPSDPRPSRTTLARSPVFVVSSTADTAAALEFLEFFYSSERYSRFGGELMVVSPWERAPSPVYDTASDRRSYSRIVSAAENAVVLPLHRRSGKIMPQIARIVDKLDAGLISPDKAAKEILEAVAKKSEPPKPPRSASIRVSWAESTRRLSVDDTISARSVPVRISAAGNERESFQLVIQADGETDGLTLGFAPFASDGGDPLIVRMEARSIEDTYISKPLVTDRAGLYPNVLEPLDEFGVSPGKLARIWVSAYVDASMPPGEYSSRMTITRGGKVAAEIPIELRVFPLKIPKTPSQPAFMGLNYNSIAGHHGIDAGSDEYRELMDAYYWYLVERRMTPLTPPAPLDSPRLATYMNDARVSGVRIPFDPADKRFEDAVALAEEGGWLEKTFSYFIDEPTYHQYDEILEAARRIYSMPAPPRSMVACFPDDRLIGAVDIWLIHLPFLPVGIPRGHMERTEYAEAVDRRLKAGDEVWWYTAGAVAPFPTLHIEDDPSAFRIIPWMQQLYGINGFLHWEAANWNSPIDEPFIEFFGNGEGVLVYPGDEGPLSSIRLELFGEGLEDMEYLMLLGRSIEKIQRRLGAKRLGDAAAVRVGEICRRLIEDHSLRASASREMLLLPYFSREPGRIERVREQLADEIIAVGERPYAIVLTEPEEKRYTESEHARIFGAVEPGCRITINGRGVPVDETGGFSARFPLHGGTNNFDILLGNGEHTKLIERKIEKF